MLDFRGKPLRECLQEVQSSYLVHYQKFGNKEDVRFAQGVHDGLEIAKLVVRAWEGRED